MYISDIYIDNKVHIDINVKSNHCGIYTFSHIEKGKYMNIIITNSAGVPIYEQICSQIKGLIMSGKLKEGDPLPSMRTLAQDLRVSVITTKKAYELLERDGLIESYTGKGSFVAAKNPELLREQNLKEIEGYLQKAADIARTSGVSLEEITDILSVFYSE